MSSSQISLGPSTPPRHFDHYQHLVGHSFSSGRLDPKRDCCPHHPVRLPNAESAIVDEAKVRDYLLLAANPRSRGKPAFFHSLGYGLDNAELLRQALLKIAESDTAEEGKPSPFGRKFEIRATLSGPSGRTARINTVWIIETGTTAPRFVTAYPS